MPICEHNDEFYFDPSFVLSINLRSLPYAVQCQIHVIRIGRNGWYGTHHTSTALLVLYNRVIISEVFSFISFFWALFSTVSNYCFHTVQMNYSLSQIFNRHHFVWMVITFWKFNKIQWQFSICRSTLHISHWASEIFRRMEAMSEKHVWCSYFCVVLILIDKLRNRLCFTWVARKKKRWKCLIDV